MSEKPSKIPIAERQQGRPAISDFYRLQGVDKVFLNKCGEVALNQEIDEERQCESGESGSTGKQRTPHVATLPQQVVEPDCRKDAAHGSDVVLYQQGAGKRYAKGKKGYPLVTFGMPGI